METQCRNFNKPHIFEAIMNTPHVKNWMTESEGKVTEHHQNLYNEQMAKFARKTSTYHI